MKSLFGQNRQDAVIFLFSDKQVPSDERNVSNVSVLMAQDFGGVMNSLFEDTLCCSMFHFVI